MKSRVHKPTIVPGSTPDQEGGTTVSTTPARLSAMQRIIIGLAIAAMVAVGIAGGIGTYTNIGRAYGSGTAIGALAAGEGATAVLALLLLGLTMLGQSSPLVIRIGLWALPGAAAAMGATAATGSGQMVVYALTPMAITASAEGLAFLVRQIAVHQAGRDIEAEARAARIVRNLAYHQARAAAHPKKSAAARSVRKSWRLARHVGAGDITLAAGLLDVQRTRLTQGADVALARMFAPGLAAGADTGLTALPGPAPASAPAAPALPPASTGDATAPQAQESTIPADTSGYPPHSTPERAGESNSVRPALELVRDGESRGQSIAEDVRQMVRDGVGDIRFVLDAVAARHDRRADDPKFRSTVARYVRQARAKADAEARTRGQYL